MIRDSFSEMSVLEAPKLSLFFKFFVFFLECFFNTGECFHESFPLISHASILQLFKLDGVAGFVLDKLQIPLGCGEAFVSDEF